MKLKILFVLIIMSLFFGHVYAAYLGVFESGDTVTYSVVCLADEGDKDTGCSAPDDDILDPDDTTAKSPTVALAEVSDANFPGLWRGSYLIPGSPLYGTWSIFIELTNSNSTTAATVLHFSVVNEVTNTTDIWGAGTRTLTALDEDDTTIDLDASRVLLSSATETQIDDIETDTAAMDTSTELRTLLTGSDTAVSTLTSSSNIGINWADISNQGTSVDLSGTDIQLADTCTAVTDDVNLLDATEAQIDNTETIVTGLSVNDSWINASLGNIVTDTNELQTNQNWNVWDDGTRTLTAFTASWIDTECTDATELAVVQDDIKSNVSAERAVIITQGDSAWATATGFSTHSAADVDTQLNTSHSTGNWSDVCSGFSTLTAAQVDTQLNASHGTGNWSDVASGFSTLTAAQVWSYSTRTLSSFGTLVVDIWASVLGSGSTANATITEINETVTWIERLLP